MGLKVSFTDGAESVNLGANTGRPVTNRPYDEVVAAGGFEWLNPVGGEGDDGREEEELKFDIDGRGGERITGVSVSSRMGPALKVCSNNPYTHRHAPSFHHHQPPLTVMSFG